MSRNSNGSLGSSSSDNDRSFPQVGKCDCGVEVPVVTSWTQDNPGRRFYCCPKYKKRGSCGVFKWVDAEMCDRSKKIIPGLLKRINKLQADVAWYKDNEEKMEFAKKKNEEKIELEKRTLEGIIELHKIKIEMLEKDKGRNEEAMRRLELSIAEYKKKMMNLAILVLVFFFLLICFVLMKKSISSAKVAYMQLN